MGTEGAAPFLMVAGHVALDFANTLDNRFDPARTVELLGSYGDLLRFCEQAGVLSEAQVRRALRSVGGEDALQSAVALREAIERIFSAVANQRPAPGADLAVLNRYVSEASAHRKIVRRNGRFTWVWHGLDQGPGGPLWPIANAAAELLVSDDLGLVRECRNETCRWLFLDSSKNHTRVWCDMKLCGNRTKARRYYERHG